MHEILVMLGGPPYKMRCIRCQRISLKPLAECIRHQCEERPEGYVWEKDSLVTSGAGVSEEEYEEPY